MSQGQTPIIEVEALAAQIFEQARMADMIEDEAKKSRAILNDLKLLMLATLKEAGLEGFKSSAGTLSISHRTSVKTPKTVEEKDLLFNYLREKNLFMEMVSVNSMTLNSFYKSELDDAIARGDSEWHLPGVGEAEISEILYMRKK